MFRKIDERKTILSRINYKKDTPMYAFYNEYPALLDVDEALRKKGSLFRTEAKQYDPILSRFVEGNFDFLKDLRQLTAFNELPEKQPVNPVKLTDKIKMLSKHYGASLVGITKMIDRHYYSIRGRGPSTYGKTVGFPHLYGIVIAVEMDYDYMMEAPRINESIETSNIYVKVAMIAMQISYFIRSFGYPARSHIDGDYLVNAPAVAVSAGLGEFGRIGLLVNKTFGPRVRLAVITTNLPLIEDSMTSFNLKEFCLLCRQCAKACPRKAIPKGKYLIQSGIKGWKINQEACFNEWLDQGTDCGICLRACPFFHKNRYHMPDVLKKSKKEQVEFIRKHEVFLSSLDQS